MEKEYLFDIKGTKVRRQYLNWLLSVLILFFEIVVICNTISKYNINDFELFEWMKNIISDLYIFSCLYRCSSYFRF